jgi:hypothetical protein
MAETPGPDKIPPLTPLRLFFAIAGGLVVLFAGGCGLLYAGIGVYSAVNGDPYGQVFITMGLMLGGGPALIGGLIWWAALKWRRG